jgi:hypothetical protein
MTIVTKIKLTLALGGAAALFAWPGWWWIDGAEPRSAVTVVLSESPLNVALAGMLLGIVATSVAMLIGRTQAWQYALAAGPAGLTAWALRGAGAQALLVAHPTPQARQAMYAHMGWDVLAWAAVVLVGYLFALAVLRLLGRRQTPAPAAAAGKPVAGGHARKGVSPKETPRSDWLSHPWIRNTLAAVLTVVGAALLVALLAQSYETWVGTDRVQNLTLAPAKMQAVFAVAAAFFLATLGVDQLFSPHLEALLGGPVVLGTVTCWWAAIYVDTTASPIVAQLLPEVLPIATISPVTFVGAGLLAVQGGYWYSRHLHRERRQALAAQAV